MTNNDFGGKENRVEEMNWVRSNSVYMRLDRARTIEQLDFYTYIFSHLHQEAE